MKPMDTLPQLYRKQMMEVKRRLNAIDRILGAKKGKPRTLTEDYDNEFMWLQLRKVVELTAFSAIAADKERYVALRFEQDANSNYQNDWRAEKILGHLSKINPKFLPQALGQMQVQPDGVKYFDGLASAQQATLKRLVSIHQTAGEYLHSGNPFDANNEQHEAEMRTAARARIETEYTYLKTILAEHYKVGLEFQAGGDPKSLDNPKQAWIVVLGKPETPEILMMQADALPAAL
jgi:hypothetical protein